jgi:FdhE protein
MKPMVTKGTQPVVSGLLDRLFACSAALPVDVEEALGELARLRQQRPALAAPAALLSDILPDLYAAPIRDAACALDPEHAATKLAAGVPLLRGELLTVDGEAFRRRWLHVCGAVGNHHDGDAASALADALRSGCLEPQSLIAELLAGRLPGIYERANALSLDAALAATVLRLTLFPLLSAVSAALIPLCAGFRWDHGFCPICGSWPLFAEFRGLEQTRILRCGLCASEWEFSRLCCPFCVTRDHQQLGYLHVEGEESKYRAAVCDMCRGYVKTIATLAPLRGPQLLVADLAMMHLDLAAAERGFATPP